MGESPDLVALLHERVLRDDGARSVLEGAQDLDDDAVHPAELDGTGLHDLGALVGELEHLLVADQGQLPGGGLETGIGGEDAAHVREDLAAVGMQPRRERDGRRVRASAPERGRLALVACRLAQPLEAGDDDDLARVELGPDPAWLDAGDPRLAVTAVSGDPRQRDRRDAECVERHRQQSRALVLSGREEDVELARVGLVRDRAGEREELVGRVAHRGDDDDELGSPGTLTRDPPRHAPDAMGVGERRTTVFLHDEGARHRTILSAARA